MIGSVLFTLLCLWFCVASLEYSLGFNVLLMDLCLVLVLSLCFACIFAFVLGFGADDCWVVIIHGSVVALLLEIWIADVWVFFGWLL